MDGGPWRKSVILYFIILFSFLKFYTVSLKIILPTNETLLFKNSRVNCMRVKHEVCKKIFKKFHVPCPIIRLKLKIKWTMFFFFFILFFYQERENSIEFAIMSLEKKWRLGIDRWVALAKIIRTLFVRSLLSVFFDSSPRKINVDTVDSSRTLDPCFFYFFFFYF